MTAISNMPALPSNATVEDVVYAYRLLLGRMPDEAGLQHHLGMIREGAVDPLKLGDSFVGSQEFQARSAQHTGIEELELDGYSMFVRLEDRDIGRWVKQEGQWESHVTAVVKRTLKPGNTFVDVGANIGYFAAMAAHQVGSAGQVIAVEPLEKNVQLIYASAWRNGWQHVRVHQLAASEEFGFVGMATGVRTSNGTAQQLDSQAETVRPSLFAQSAPLDDVIGTLERIDLLKFDIEGFELKAWRGFAKTIARTRPIILTEFHPYCLRHYGNTWPESYLATLFEYAGRIQLLLHDGSAADCRDVESVLARWGEEDLRFNSNGTTHIDLVVTPRQ